MIPPLIVSPMRQKKKTPQTSVSCFSVGRYDGAADVHRPLLYINSDSDCDSDGPSYSLLDCQTVQEQVIFIEHFLKK